MASCLSPCVVGPGVVFTELTSICLFNVADLYHRCFYDVVFTGNTDNKSLVYSRTKALLQPSKKLTSSSPLAGLTCNKHCMESEIERELPDT